MIFVTIKSGASPHDARPLVASSDPDVAHAVLRALADHIDRDVGKASTAVIEGSSSVIETEPAGGDRT